MLTSETNEPGVRAHSRLDYLPALDGLRAIAVLGVLLYHADIPLFKGGFLGVDVFFVISGYLITSLLLGEWRQSGTVDLKAFWLRRARRLLPALYLLLAVVLIYSVFFLHDEVARLRSDATAAFGYVTNWYLIFNQQSYFETMGRPSLFQHLWSLAVEEQFYLLWPILFLLLMKFVRRFALPIVIAGALASAGLMALMYSPDTDPSRVYYGTDTRAAALLIGVALAFILSRNPASTRSSFSLGILQDVAGTVALFAVLGFFVFADQLEPFLYLGGLLLLEVIVAVLIAAIALPGGHVLPRVLGSMIPKWIGLRSYGIYLWHWPVFMLTRERVDVDFGGLPLLALRFGITLVLAEISYRFVEIPIRHGALQRLWKDLRTPRQRRINSASLRLGATLATLLVMVVTLGPAIVSARPPDQPDYLPGESINTVDPGIDTGGDPLEENTPVEGELPLPIESPIIQEATATRTLLPTSAPTNTSTTSTATSSPTSESVSTAETIATEQATVTPTATATQMVRVTETETATPFPLTPTLTPAVVDATASVAVATPTVFADPEPGATSVGEPPTLTAEPATETPTPVPGSTTPSTEPTTTVSVTPVPSGTPGDVQALGRIVAIGDSVMLGAAKELMKAVPNIAVDAKVSRQAAATISLLTSYKQAGLLGDVVVIHIGNNGTITTKQFDQIMTILTDTRWVVFVNLSVPRQWEAPNNKLLADGATRYPNVVIVDWHSDSVNHRDYFAKDGYHLQPLGQREYAALILAKLRTLVPSEAPEGVATPEALGTPTLSVAEPTLTLDASSTAEPSATLEPSPTAEPGPIAEASPTTDAAFTPEPTATIPVP